MQRPGIDFHYTFAPVARLGSLRLLMALAARTGMTISQLDVTTAYPNGKIDTEIFMQKRQLLEEMLNRIVRAEESHTYFEEEDKDDTIAYPFRELIGALMYVAIGTRPDITHAVNSFSQFNGCNRNVNWTAAKCMLRYLKGTIDLKLVYKKDNENLRGYNYADWGNCIIDRRSYTGSTFILSGAKISWESRKQRTVALSSTEAEYMSITNAAKEEIYLMTFERIRILKIGQRRALQR
ncbi:secreted RxLR effector protein 161-like [Belonocnema kinseyi]|uniref:secreted RxLR effector protein 161-like n=1 Tax=Belonocnema kinseyi TaxID=2817044 RepID=UPI00143DA26C|nr:secreted RxLR effector protein 161-like [Belonocnema kinseyi]